MTERGALTRAFELAHSIYRFRKRDREIALRIVGDALSALQVRLIAQHEADRHRPQRPTKVRWNSEQWLQLMIFYQSERFEREQEKERLLLTREDMLTRYLKHLILTTVRRNSFYVSVGLGRLIYAYEASENVAIYDFVFQDPDLSTRKADPYYRSVKNRILEELARRFEGFVKVEQRSRNEKRFQSDPSSRSLNNLVVDCLNRFTPWATSCKLPAKLDSSSTVPSLQISQASQIHSLIHPACFSRITRLLKLDPPETRLELPMFLFNSEGSSHDDEIPAELTIDEVGSIRKHLSDLNQSRKDFAPISARILTDGTERGRLDLTRPGNCRFEIDESVTLIEILGDNGNAELLLGSHLRTFEEDGDPVTYSIALGRRSAFYLLIRESFGASGLASVEVSHLKVRPSRSWWD